MGRTIHFELELPNKLTKKQAEILYEISDIYTSGDWEKAWSCECFYLDPYAHYPRWDKYKSEHKEGGPNKVWEIIDKRYKELRDLGNSRVDAMEIMLKDKDIELHKPITNKVSSFTKIQGNEYNAVLIFQALIQISKAIPQGNIHIHDEGEFLLCDVYLKNGRVKPDLGGMKKEIHRYAAGILLREGEEILSQIEYRDEIERPLLEDMGFYKSTGYDFALYINQKLRNLKAIQERVRPYMRGQMCVHNVQALEYDPWLFTRKVDTAKYESYICTPGTMMDGFDGEGFGLTDKDSEQESYEMIAKMVKMTEGLGTVEIIGEENVGKG